MLGQTASKQFSIQILAFGLGLTSLVGQLILLRELIVVFSGNEMAYAVVFSAWLFWIAVGSLLASRCFDRIKDVFSLLMSFLVVIYIVLPFTLFLIRFLKVMMGLSPGEIMGVLPICLASYLITAPLTVILGAIFSLICHFAEDGVSKDFSVSRIYFWEAVGAAVGGLLFNFVLIRLMTAMEIVFFVGLFNVILLIILQKSRNGVLVGGIILLVLTVYFNLSGGVNRFDSLTRRLQWKGFDIVAIADSVYGNIVLTKRDDQYSLFENGAFSFSTKDELTQEESVHYALLEHPRPEKILLIGNGMSGSLSEILKHPVFALDYLELDPMVMDILKKYLPERYFLPSLDVRVRMIFQDARFFVKRAESSYDVVIVNLPDPSSAMLNRYYSLEFFKEVRRLMTDSGVLSLRLTSSENSLNEENRQYLRSIYTTLAQVFGDIRSVPGGSHVFLACPKSGVLTTDPKVFINRLKQRKIKTDYVNAYYLPDKLRERRLLNIEEILKEKGAINTDLRPISYLHNLVLWSTQFDSRFQGILKGFSSIPFWGFFILPIMIFLSGYILRKRMENIPFIFSILTTGFLQIIFQLLIVYGFQILYGFVYYKIGIIMALFMAGLAWGSWVANKILVDPKMGLGKIFKMYRLVQLGICVYPLILLGSFMFFDYAISIKNKDLFSNIFIILSVWTGFLGGVQFPLAVYLMSKVSNLKRVQMNIRSRMASLLYGIDTIGAAVGALMAGIVLIPLLGIPLTCFLCISISLSILIIL